ncbi:hypothetical protein MMC07_000707 [Pseudocyphellaria aurata]|nr:hypothetical protein [Pseudocyphellaria aurata]
MSHSYHREVSNHQDLEASMGSFDNFVDDFHRDHPDAMTWGFVGGFDDAIPETDSPHEDHGKSLDSDNYRNPEGSNLDPAATASTGDGDLAELVEAGSLPQTPQFELPSAATSVDEQESPPQTPSSHDHHDEDDSRGTPDPSPHDHHGEAENRGTPEPDFQGYEEWLAAQGESDLVNPLVEYTFGRPPRDGIRRLPSPPLMERIEAANAELQRVAQAGVDEPATTTDDTTEDRSGDEEMFFQFTHHYRRRSRSL